MPEQNRKDGPTPGTLAPSPAGGEGGCNAKSLERSVHTTTSSPTGTTTVPIGQEASSTTLAASSSSAVTSYGSSDIPTTTNRRTVARRDTRSDRRIESVGDDITTTTTTTTTSEEEGPLLRPRRRELSNLNIAQDIVEGTAESEDGDQHERRHFARIPSKSAFRPREREWHFLSSVADEILEGIDDSDDDDNIDYEGTNDSQR